jgi:hypothetical protein
MQDHFFPARAHTGETRPGTASSEVEIEGATVATNVFSEARAAVPTPDSGATFQDCVEQAEICCNRARDARAYGRMEAARGLYSTAIMLCQHALAMCKTSDNTTASGAITSKSTNSDVAEKHTASASPCSCDNEAAALIQLSRAYSELVLCHR